MFEPKDEIGEAVEKLWKLAESVERGEVLSYDAIQQATGLDRTQAMFFTVVKRFRKRLLDERSIAVWAVNGVGYRMLTHSEQVRFCAEHRQRRMYRQARRAINEVSAVDGGTLSMHERMLQNAQLDRLTKEQRAIRASIKEIVKGPRVTETLPRKADPCTA